MIPIDELHRLLGHYPHIYEATGFQERFDRVENDPPQNLLLETLGEYRHKMSLSPLLLNVPLTIIEEEFGDDVLLWLWLHVPDGEQKQVRDAYARTTEKDSGLLEKIQRALEKQGVHQDAALLRKAYTLVETIDHTVKQVDCDEVLTATAKSALTDEKKRKYQVIPLHTPQYDAVDYAKAWKHVPTNNGQERISIALASMVGIAILYKGAPEAVCSFFPDKDDTLMIYEMQGISWETVGTNGTFRRGRPIWKKPGPVGLIALDWKKLMIMYVQKIAKLHDFTHVGIQSAENNYWTRKRYNDTGDVHLPLDRAVRIYDETAIRLGFRRETKTKNWYREVI